MQIFQEHKNYYALSTFAKNRSAEPTAFSALKRIF